MATTVTVTGKIFLPSGSGVTGGVLEITLSGVPESGEIEDVGVTHKISGKILTSISGIGAVSVQLVPNDVILPSGSYYTVVYKPLGQDWWTEYWQLASAPATIDIGDVTLLAPPVATPASLVIPGIGVLPTPGAGYVGWLYRIPGGAGVEDQVAVCLKTGSDTYVWQIWAVGGP